MTITVFLGPSLPRPEADRILAADYRPPVRQGDLYRLMRQRRPQTIAIIDGYFQEVPSVWHKEILWALDQDVPVYGAASMGALRAAELDRYGMIGFGKIYEAYRSGCYSPYESESFEDDDEVAVIHGPAELGFPALSDAMVDLRETLAAAAAAGIIDAGLRDALVAGFKGRFYRERSLSALPQMLAELSVERPREEALLAWLPAGRVLQKAADARGLLERLASDAPVLPAERESFVFERTTLWVEFVEQASDAPSISPAERQVLDELRLEPEIYAVVRATAALHHRLALGAPPPAVDAAARRRALDRLRRRHGLWSRQALDAWTADCDLDRAGLDRLLEFESVLEDCARAAGPALDGALLDVMRRDGRYSALAARARDKQRCLQQTGALATAPSALSPEALLDWYFEKRLARSVPADAAGYATDLGFGALEEFLAALARERDYLAVRASAGAPVGASEAGSSATRESRV